jgi:hypothetical protein
MERVLRYQRKVIEKKCVQCGVKFYAKRRLRPICSKECKRVRRLKARPKTAKECGSCKKSFLVSHLKRKYCSLECKYDGMRTGRKKKTVTIAKARSAQSLLAYHVKVGKIIRPTVCEQCNATDRKIEAAHFNYDEPLRVRWLCRSCHVKWDRAEPKGATYVVVCA